MDAQLLDINFRWNDIVFTCVMTCVAFSEIVNASRERSDGCHKFVVIQETKRGFRHLPQGGELFGVSPVPLQSCRLNRIVPLPLAGGRMSSYFSPSQSNPSQTAGRKHKRTPRLLATLHSIGLDFDQSMQRTGSATSIEPGPESLQQQSARSISWRNSCGCTVTIRIGLLVIVMSISQNSIENSLL